MGFFKETIRNVPLSGDTVLVRADYNVPLDNEGNISDDLRIKASLPTLRYLLKRGCKVVIISHLGRPEGHEKKYSLEPIANRLSELLKKEVTFVDDTVGDTVYQAVRRAPKNSVLLLENLRFYEEEEKDSHAFAKAIVRSTRAAYFVQDGFGVVHRAHASTHALTLYLPSVAGLLLEKEYSTITKAMSAPKQPLVAIMGGAKVSDKIGVIERFVAIADKILIGGAMANTFLAYRGLGTGASKVESDQKETLDRLYTAAAAKVGAGNVDDFIILPVDVAVAPRIDPSEKRHIRAVTAIAADDIALDVGDKSIEIIAAHIASAKTVIWNGTLGYAELPEFAHGSARLALALATHPDIKSIIGGGDTADFALKWDGGTGNSFSHVSTGGGASLDLMAGKKLPGVESLLDARN
ncbi:MAG: phosphoglycerate kinase [Chloroflexi bacterium]|nr:MAG: phosphoglycerate kinase [Chloroflexota bacterium]